MFNLICFQVPEPVFGKESPSRKVETKVKDSPQRKEQSDQQPKKIEKTRPHVETIPAEKLPLQKQVEVYIMNVVHPNKFTVVECKNYGMLRLIGEKMMAVS